MQREAYISAKNEQDYLLMQLTGSQALGPLPVAEVCRGKGNF